MTSGRFSSIHIRVKDAPMSREEKNKIEYITMCIFLFTSRFGMQVLDALGYLLDFGGISFLEDGYDIEHTLPIEDTLEALQVICARNGGNSHDPLSWVKSSYPPYRTRTVSPLQGFRPRLLLDHHQIADSGHGKSYNAAADEHGGAPMTDVEYLQQSVTRGLAEILVSEKHMSLDKALGLLGTSNGVYVGLGKTKRD